MKEGTYKGRKEMGTRTVVFKRNKTAEKEGGTWRETVRGGNRRDESCSIEEKQYGRK